MRATAVNPIFATRSRRLRLPGRSSGSSFERLVRASSMQYEGPQPGDEDIMEGPAHLARESILPFIIAELTPDFWIFCPDTGDGNLTDEWTDRYIFRF